MSGFLLDFLSRWDDKGVMTITTNTQRKYVAAYRDVIHAVSDVNAYITPALARQIDALESQMTEDEIERLREVARGF